MNDKVFPDGNQLPPLVRDIVHENSLEAMTPGETTWATPWSISTTEEGAVVINPGAIERGRTPGGTVTLKLVSDFEGVYVDATALSVEDMQRYLQPGAPRSVVGDEGVRLLASGVLYPSIQTTEGLDPKAVGKFNDEQRELKRRFSDYYKRTYSQDYVFAEDEVRRTSAGLTSSLGQIAAQHDEPRRWGRRAR